MHGQPGFNNAAALAQGGGVAGQAIAAGTVAVAAIEGQPGNADAAADAVSKLLGQVQPHCGSKSGSSHDNFTAGQAPTSVHGQPFVTIGSLHKRAGLEHAGTVAALHGQPAW